MANFNIIMYIFFSLFRCFTDVMDIKYGYNIIKGKMTLENSKLDKYCKTTNTMKGFSWNTDAKGRMSVCSAFQYQYNDMNHGRSLGRDYIDLLPIEILVNKLCCKKNEYLTYIVISI